MSSIHCCDHPELPDYKLYHHLQSRKVTGGVEGDLPPVVMKELMVELVKPIGIIYRHAFGTHTWPFKWKKEHNILAHKIPFPITLDDVRSLGLTQNI